MGYHSLGISLYWNPIGLAPEAQKLRKQQLLMVSSLQTLFFRNNFTDLLKGECITFPLSGLLQRWDTAVCWESWQVPLTLEWCAIIRVIRDESLFHLGAFKAWLNKQHQIPAL